MRDKVSNISSWRNKFLALQRLFMSKHYYLYTKYGFNACNDNSIGGNENIKKLVDITEVLKK